MLQVVHGAADSVGRMSEILLPVVGQEISHADSAAEPCEGEMRHAERPL